MITIENSRVYNIAGAVYAARNPLNSWAKSDSDIEKDILGPNDLGLAQRLLMAGPDHSKFMRQIFVSCDITAPFYWHKEMSTYKVGTVANSCSTMHKLTAKPFEMNDFSYDHMNDFGFAALQRIVTELNTLRDVYLATDNATIKRDAWYTMIQLLPTSYNQRRTWTANYAVLHNIYFARRNHKLDEWHDFCDWILSLPYAKELIAFEG